MLSACRPLAALALGLLAAPLGAAAWNSAFVLSDGSGGWSMPAVNVSGRDFRIPDHSYAGYKLSEKGLGEGIPCFSVTVTAANGTDITSLIRAGISTVAAAGGGTVYIAPGTFNISQSITVNSDNLRICGAGSSATTLTVTAAYTANHALYDGTFIFTGATGNIATWMEQPLATLSTTASQDVPLGAMSVTVTSAAGWAAGDWVVLQQFFTSNFVILNSNNTWPTVPASQSQYEFSHCYLRKVSRVAGSVLTLDAPIPKTLATAANPILVYRPNASNYLENVGIEGLTLQVAPNSNEAGLPSGIAVMFKAAFNAWARDVKVNNIAKHGLQPIWSARVTYLDCAVTGAQYLGGGGNGYGFHINASQAVLVRRCSSSDARHNSTLQKAMCSDVVFSRFSSIRTGVNAAYYQDDTHHSWAHNVLWDSLSQTGAGFSAMNRGTTSTNAWETFAGGTIWNLSGDGTTANPQAGKVQFSPETHTAESQGQVIGVWGGHRTYDGSSFETGSYVTGPEVTGAALQRGGRGNVAYEGLGSAGLQPASLFEGQLFTRMGHLMPPELAPDACAPPTPTPSSTRTATPGLPGTATATPSSTASSTPTRSPTVSASATPTRSVTGTASATRSATPSSTASPSATVSSSATASSSSSATPTPVLQSPTPTLSSTPSATVTATRSASATHSFTGTGTPSQSPSSTPTASSSASSSWTPSATPTDPPPGSSATFTSTANPTRSSTTTRTASPTATASATTTPSLTATPSLSPLASSTATASPTELPLTDAWDPIDDLSSGATLLVPAAGLQSHGPHVLSSADAGDWYSVDMIAGQQYHFFEQSFSSTSGAAKVELFWDAAGTSLVATEDGLIYPGAFHLDLPAPATGRFYYRVSAKTPGGNWSGTIYYFVVAPSSPTLSFTPTGTATPATAPPLATATPESRSLAVLALAPLPNPGTKALLLKLAGAAERVRVRIYTPDLKAVAQAEAGPAGPGWTQLPLPAAWLLSAPNGAYFAVAWAERGPERGPRSRACAFYLLR